MTIPIIVNILLLLGFKYTGFAVLNANRLFGMEYWNFSLICGVVCKLYGRPYGVL